MPSKQKKFHREKLAFIKKMLPDTKVNFPREMAAAKKIFDHFENDVDFLLSVKPPFKLKDSILYLISEKGIQYLELKRKEFYFKPKEVENHFESGEKCGDDVQSSRTQTLRQFLYE